MIMIFINEHQGPLTIWPVQSVNGNQHVPGRILYITGSAIEEMLGIFGLRPILRQQFGREELRRGLQDLLVIIHHEQVVGSPAIRADRVGGEV